MKNYIKTVLFILSFMVIASVANAQSNYEDVVYLKNGSIIHGIIIEQVPNQSIKIKTKDNNFFVFKIDEIEKITKEIPANNSGGKYFSLGVQALENITEILSQNESQDPALQKTIGYDPGFEVNVTYFFSDKIGLSLGLGYCHYSDEIIWNLPVTNTVGGINYNISGDYKEFRDLSFFEIPITLHLFDGQFNKTHFYLNPGLRFGFLSGVNNVSEGFITIDQTFNGHENKNSQNMNSTNNSTQGYSSFILFGTISAGVSIPIKSKIKINIGADFRYGFTDIVASDYRNDYISINYSTQSYLSHNLIGYGLEAGISYKLSN